MAKDTIVAEIFRKSHRKTAGPNKVKTTAAIL